MMHQIKRLKQLLKHQYVFYGFSTVFGRGLEYLMLLFVAAYISKIEYGEFEFYKKTIEFFSILISFGTPTIMLSYTKSSYSKINFLLISFLLTLLISLVVYPFLSYYDLTFLWFPIVFYSLFFYSNSLFQSFILVKEGSNMSGLYKIFGSLFINILIIILVFNNIRTSKSFIEATKIGLYIYAPFITIIFFKFWKQGSFIYLKRYFKLFKKIVYGSFTLVINNYATIAFLYTDIYIIKFFSDVSETNTLIANYSFPLNIANALMIIPLTIAQVDIEKIKINHDLIKIVINKTKMLVLLGATLLTPVYIILISFKYYDFQSTIYLFIIILAAKIVQSFSVPYGMFLLVQKKFNTNLVINIIALVLNIVLSVLAYRWFGIYGVALASLFSLTLRLFIYKTRFKISLYRS